MLLVIFLLIVFLITSIILVLRLHPVFGGRITKKNKEGYSASKQWKNNQFEYTEPTDLSLAFRKIPGIIYKQFTGLSYRRPSGNIEVLKPQWQVSAHPESAARLVWFGHSTFLMEMSGKTILIDPMFGKVPAPHPGLGNPRFNLEMPIDPESLPPIDIVLMTHDHYDHLDYGSIQKIKHKVHRFIMPLGVKRHFLRWGIPDEKLTEMDWWEDIKLDGLQLICTPARHFSGRSMGDRCLSLWCSWVLQSDKENIFCSGDSGYGPHFKEIGQRYGPFDFAMVECGQYYKDWSLIHMLPEEAALVAVELRTKVAMPIHWGAFTLAFHSWTEPVERFLTKAKELKVNICTPRIGEIFTIGEKYPESHWWKEY